MMSIRSGNNHNYNNNRLVLGHHPSPCFSPSQWQELEHQALVFKYMVSGIPIPQDLLKTSCSSSHIIGSWNRFDMGRKTDTEPGRCRRTDGKKWRCSKEAHPDSKYCERHMHRGRNRSTGASSRKEITSPQPNNNPIIQNALPHFLSKPSSPILKTTGSSGSSLMSHVKILKHEEQQQHQHPEKVMHHFLDEGPSSDQTSSIPNYLHDFFITQRWYGSDSIIHLVS